MALFQNTVVQKYINSLDQKKVKEAYQSFAKHFHNPEVQENIRNSKEEQYQEGFLTNLFVNALGYVINPNPGFNLTTELKNVKDAKKVDGAIIIDEKVRAVIELKGMDTTDLGKVENQAFGYKNNQAGCTYVITSNFEKLRFYIDNAIDHIEFNLFKLTEAEFKLLYVCLSFENISKDIPKKLKKESLSQEDAITNKLYKDYSVFKRELFANLVELNPGYDQLLLFKKSQKLLDRFLFLFFAEDRHLLPPNSVRLILTDWDRLQEMDAGTPLYSRFKKYFGYLNTGFKGKRYDVFAYNGGLFLPDEVLDSVKINDQLLYEHTLRLSEYDFDSEVDVNILGHIFENSLNELDEIQAELEGGEFDKTKTKRKKDGVFYTPKYITKYIVENTVGKLCEEKKEELKLDEEKYTSDRKSSVATKKKLLKTLEDYRNWLLELTIIDPACGSGAFLNQALDFLIAEHEYLDELETKLTGGGIVFPNIENSILENNLFGVDLNEESVEIAKLSLWLRTAQPNRKLNDLNNNLKCGNSLIDDPEIAGDKAFNWEQEFPKVFAKGGFDVVIGNPPYLNLTKSNTNEKWLEFYIEKYYSIKTANSKNLYTLFNEKAVAILKENGLLSFIIPEGFLKTRSYVDCVNYLNEKGQIYKAIYFEDWVFADATTGSVIFEYIKNKITKLTFKDFLFKNDHEISEIIDENKDIITKYEKSNFPLLSTIADSFKGMAVKNRKEFISKESNEENQDLFLLGNCIDRYLIKDRFYTNYNHLTIVGGTKSQDKYLVFPRILVRRTGDYLCCSFIDRVAYTESTLYSVSPKTDEFQIKYLLALLNSKFLSFIVKANMITNKQAFPQILMTDLNLLKIPKADFEIQQYFVEKADYILSYSKSLLELSSKFQRTLQRKFPEELEKLQRKLETWYELDFAEFVKELKKKKIKLALAEEADWEDYFLAEQAKAMEIKNQIDATDKEIDQMVYELYGLTDEEIEIVENS